MRRRSLVSIGLLLALAGGVAVFLNWLLFTQQGLDFAIAQLERLPTLQIEVCGARGTLAGPLTRIASSSITKPRTSVARGRSVNLEPGG